MVLLSTQGLLKPRLASNVLYEASFKPLILPPPPLGLQKYSIPKWAERPRQSESLGHIESREPHRTQLYRGMVKALAGPVHASVWETAPNLSKEPPQKLGGKCLCLPWEQERCLLPPASGGWHNDFKQKQTEFSRKWKGMRPPSQNETASKIH